MHRIPAALAVLGLSALTLVACASAPSAQSCERHDTDSTVLDVVKTTGGFGAPTLIQSAPVYVPETTFTDRTVGDGPRITSGQQPVTFDIVISNGSSGEILVPSGSTPPAAVDSFRETYPGLSDMLMCATEGSRIVGAIPASDLGESITSQLGLTGKQSIVVTVDLTKVYLAAADGTPQYNDRRGMPAVVLAPNGQPGVVIPDSAAPTTLTVETLKKGSGAVISDSDTARVQYTGVDWDTRTVTNSTWDAGTSAGVGKGSNVAFASQLVGATVGSQLLIVEPASGGKGSATVYVVDILGIDPPSTPTR